VILYLGKLQPQSQMRFFPGNERSSLFHRRKKDLEPRRLVDYSSPLNPLIQKVRSSSKMYLLPEAILHSILQNFLLSLSSPTRSKLARLSVFYYLFFCAILQASRSLSVDKLQLTGRILGRVFNSRSGSLCDSVMLLWNKTA